MTDARNLEGTGVLLLEGGAFRALESYVPASGGWTDSTFVNINSGGNYVTVGAFGSDTWDAATPSGIKEHYGFGSMMSFRNDVSTGKDQRVKISVTETNSPWMLAVRAPAAPNSDGLGGYVVRKTGTQVYFYCGTTFFGNPDITWPTGPGTVEWVVTGDVGKLYVNDVLLYTRDFSTVAITTDDAHQGIGMGSDNVTAITYAEGSGSGSGGGGTSTAPAQVSGLTVGTIAATSVGLSWTAPSNGGSAITDYRIEYGNGTTWSTFSHSASTTTSITVTGLTAATLYYFRVSAINAVGTGTASTSVTATTTGGGSGPASTYAKATGTSCTINKPTCSVGDVLVWFMGNVAQQPVSNYQTPDASAGTWALQGAGTTDGGGGYSANVSVYTRVVTGTEASTFQANAPAGYSQEQSLAMVAVSNAAVTAAALSFAGAPHSTGPLNLPGVAVPTGGVGLVFAVSYPGFGDANAPASGPWLTLIDWNPGILLQFTGTGTSPTAVIPFGGGDTQGVQIAVAPAP